MIIQIIQQGNQSLKVVYKNKNKKYYVYLYKGNCGQDFVANEEGMNITNTKEGIHILINCRNYIFHNI